MIRPTLKGQRLVALFLLGCLLFNYPLLSLFTGRHAVLGGLRMLGIGATAGAATWLIGRALGVALG